MKTIVTHHHPDVDAVSSVWLVKCFLPGWYEADIVFVPAGETLGGKPVDEDEDVIHVDTGLGRFDHHQTSERTCAARRVYEFLRANIHNLQRQYQRQSGDQEPENSLQFHEDALDRLTQVVVDIDHFGHVFWPEPNADIYDFSFEGILDGWKMQYSRFDNDRELIEWAMRALDGLYFAFINKVWAEKELQEKGIEVASKKGRMLFIETINDDTITIAQKKGFVLAVRKDPHKGYVRIKAKPGSNIDLTDLHHVLMKEDPEATWYLHSSKMMILNGSTKNPKMRASKLSLMDIKELAEHTII